jgi:hypothetical protein
MVVMIDCVAEQQENVWQDSLQIEFGRDSLNVIAVQRIMAAGISLVEIGAIQRWMVARQPL